MTATSHSTVPRSVSHGDHAPAVDPEPGDAHALDHAHAEVVGRLGRREGGPAGVDRRVVLEEHAAGEVVDGQQRRHGGDLVARQLARRQAVVVGHASARSEARSGAPACAPRERAVGVVAGRRRRRAPRAPRRSRGCSGELGLHVGAAGPRHEPRGVPAGAARDPAALEDDRVGPAQPGQVDGDGGADDAAADHDRPRSRGRSLRRPADRSSSPSASRRAAVPARPWPALLRNQCLASRTTLGGAAAKRRRRRSIAAREQRAARRRRRRTEGMDDERDRGLRVLVGQHRGGGPGGGRGPRPGRPRLAHRRGRRRRRRRRGPHRRRRPRVRLQALVAADARRHPQEPGQGTGAGPLLPAAVRLAGGAARRGSGWAAAFDTQVRGPFGKGAPEIARLLEAAGYVPLAEPEGFVVKGRHGPLKKGEAERARAWGEQLAARPRGAAARDGRAASRRRTSHLAHRRRSSGGYLSPYSGLVPCITRAFTLDCAVSVAGGSGTGLTRGGARRLHNSWWPQLWPPVARPRLSVFRSSASSSATSHCYSTRGGVRDHTTTCQLHHR